jgi:hypothetical protein
MAARFHQLADMINNASIRRGIRASAEIGWAAAIVIFIWTVVGPWLFSGQHDELATYMFLGMILLAAVGGAWGEESRRRDEARRQVNAITKAVVSALQEGEIGQRSPLP